MFAATFHIADRSSIRNLRTRNAVVTGTHLSWLAGILRRLFNTFGAAFNPQLEYMTLW
jgi:hypothetical protein